MLVVAMKKYGYRLNRGNCKEFSPIFANHHLKKSFAKKDFDKALLYVLFCEFLHNPFAKGR